MANIDDFPHKKVFWAIHIQIQSVRSPCPYFDQIWKIVIVLCRKKFHPTKIEVIWKSRDLSVESVELICIPFLGSRRSRRDTRRHMDKNCCNLKQNWVLKNCFRITGINSQTGALARSRTAVLAARQILEAADRKTLVADVRIAEI